MAQDEITALRSLLCASGSRLVRYAAMPNADNNEVRGCARHFHLAVIWLPFECSAYVSYVCSPL